MLEDSFTDEYPLKLQTEYRFLQKKHQLQPIDKHLWKFARLRPLNFPTIRLAQFAALVNHSQHLFSQVLDAPHATDLQKLFNGIAIHPYWHSHYQFGTEAKPLAKAMGKSSVNLLLLNTVALFLFAYGNKHQLQQHINKSLHLLETLPAERNHIILSFEELGIKAANAYDSQALLELKNTCCNAKLCLQCGIGIKVLNLT